MRQREPHTADLLPPGRDVVDDPPRHHQVRLRVVMTEDEVSAPQGNPVNGRADHRGGGEKSLGSSRLPLGGEYNHGLLRYLRLPSA